MKTAVDEDGLAGLEAGGVRHADLADMLGGRDAGGLELAELGRSGNVFLAVPKAKLDGVVAVLGVGGLDPDDGAGAGLDDGHAVKSSGP